MLIWYKQGKPVDDGMKRWQVEHADPMPDSVKVVAPSEIIKGRNKTCTVYSETAKNKVVRWCVFCENRLRSDEYDTYVWTKAFFPIGVDVGIAMKTNEDGRKKPQYAPIPGMDCSFFIIMYEYPSMGKRKKWPWPPGHLWTRSRLLQHVRVSDMARLCTVWRGKMRSNNLQLVYHKTRSGSIRRPAEYIRIANDGPWKSDIGQRSRDGSILWCESVGKRSATDRASPWKKTPKVKGI